MSASFVRSVNSLMTGAPFSDRGVQHIPFPSQSPDSEPGVRWLTRAVHRRALEARDVQEHRNTALGAQRADRDSVFLPLLVAMFLHPLPAQAALAARPARVRRLALFFSQLLLVSLDGVIEIRL